MPDSFAATFAMWAIMMVGMMLPAVTPTIASFAALQRRSKSGFVAAADAMLFAAGYFVPWTIFSFVATAAQWGLAKAQLLSPEMTTTSTILGAALFIAAGGYQFTALKVTCLSKCGASQFLAERRREGPLAPLIMGFDYGVACVGCCWVLMGLLFVFGVMNLLWVAAVAIYVLVERLYLRGANAAAVAGLVMVASGVLLFILE
jgi:predicted metal-binding membrane protein